MEEYPWLKRILEQEAEPMTARQRAIVKAAAELFSEKGYAATSTKEIAQKAGVAEGTIFKHYPTKKDLMLWITERIIRTAMFPLISSGISELLAKPYANREEFLAAFMQNRLSLMQEGVPLFKIIFQEIPFQPEIRGMLMEQIKKMPINEIVKKMRAVEKPGLTGEKSDCAGKKPDYSETDVMQILLSCMVGFFFLRNMMMPELFPANRLQKDVETLVRFMDRGLRAET